MLIIVVIAVGAGALTYFLLQRRKKQEHEKNSTDAHLPGTVLPSYNVNYAAEPTLAPSLNQVCHPTPNPKPLSPLFTEGAFVSEPAPPVLNPIENLPSVPPSYILSSPPPYGSEIHFERPEYDGVKASIPSSS